MSTTSSRKWIDELDCLSEMIVVLHIVVLCRFTLRSYAANVVPASYAWSTFTGPVSGEVQEVKPWKPSSSSSSFPGFENSNEESNSYASDYVAKPQYSFAYGVENPNTGESHGHSETRDGATVTGEYSVMEPDGVLRRVQYTADPKNGFRASVRYVRPDGGETPSRDHGYQSGQNRVPAAAPRPSSLLSGYGGQPDDDDDDNGPFNVAPPQTSEFESDGGDEPFGAVPSPLPLHFGFDKYNGIINDHHANVNGAAADDDDDDDGGGGGGGAGASDYRDDAGPLTFKFPSSSPAGSFFNNKGSLNSQADPDDYGDADKYRQWGALGSPPTPFDDRPVSFGLGQPSSPAPFGLASSLSPSFGVAPPSSQQYVSFPRPAPPSFQSTEPSPCRPSLVSSGADRLAAARRPNVFSFRTNHPSGHRFGKWPADDDDNDDPDRFRSAQLDIESADGSGGGGGGDDDNEDIENHESDDNDTDNAQHVTDVQVLPPPPQPPQSQPSSAPAAPSPFYRPSLQPTAATQNASSTPAAATPAAQPTAAASESLPPGQLA